MMHLSPVPVFCQLDGSYTLLFDTDWFRYLMLGLLIVLLLVILYIIYYHLKDRMVQRIEYKREFSEEGVYETEYVTMIETITNRSWLPLFFIDIEAYIYNGIQLQDIEYDRKRAMQYVTSRFHLLPFMRIRRKHEVYCAKRGFYQLIAPTPKGHFQQNDVCARNRERLKPLHLM